MLVVDAAYPKQVAPGIEMIVCDDKLPKVVARVFHHLTEAPHVRADVFLDSELSLLHSPEAENHRAKIAELFGEPAALPHDELLKMVSAAAETYTVLVLKTPCTIPYTSVFFRLECGYWSAEEEAELRARM